MKNPRHQNGGQIQAQDERFPKLEDKFVDLVIFGNNAKMGDRIPEGTIRDKDFKKVGGVAAGALLVMIAGRKMRKK